MELKKLNYKVVEMGLHLDNQASSTYLGKGKFPIHRDRKTIVQIPLLGYAAKDPEL